MTETMLIDIGNLFINFMGAASSIALVMYFIIWIVNMLLGFIFPSRYGV